MGSVEKGPMHSPVSAGVKGDTKGRRAISTGSPCLLIVVLERPGKLIVNNDPYIRPVDTHTEGVRRHHDRASIREKVLLHPLSLLRGEARVVCLGPEPGAR